MKHLMPYAKHQIRVRLKDKLVHSSGTSNYDTALARCTDEIIKAGVGAIGRVYEYAKQNNGSQPPDETQMRPLYEGRLVYDAKKKNGSTAIVEEDHTTPPPIHNV